MRTISKAPRFYACAAARYVKERPRALDSGALCARQEVLGDDLTGGIFAAATASANGKLALHFEQGARAVVHGIANLTVTYCVADADVHLSAPRQSQPPRRPLMGYILLRIRMIVNCIGWAGHPLGAPAASVARLGAVSEFATGPGAPRGRAPDAPPLVCATPAAAPATQRGPGP
jgi:hypothetical protein